MYVLLWFFPPHSKAINRTAGAYVCVFLLRVLIPQLRNYTINIYILQEDFDLFTKYLQLKDPSFFLLFGDKKLSVRKSYENSILAYTFDLIPRNDYIL